MKRRSNHIEPGLIPIFWLFVGIRLVLLVLTLCLWLTDEGERARRLPLLGLAETTFLMGYLSWPWLRRQMGKLYLPVAILVATFAPIVSYGATVALRIYNDIPPSQLADDIWTVFFVLLIPLIVISWQYRFRSVVAFSLGTGLLETGMAVLLGASIGEQPGDWIGLLAVRTLTILAVGYTISRLMKAQRQQRAELAAANQQLTSYATTLEQLAISQERNRLARELHDTLAHSLSAVAVQLEAVRSVWEADPQAARTMLDQSLAVTRSGLTEARRAIHDLRASPLDDLGLARAIRARAEAVAERVGAALTVEVEEVALSETTEQGVYRIADEALSNIARHAEGAERIEVRLHQQNGHLHMRITDDGPGFDPARTLPNGHYGLRGLHERAMLIGGQVEIESDPGGGTTVRLEVEV